MPVFIAISKRLFAGLVLLSTALLSITIGFSWQAFAWALPLAMGFFAALIAVALVLRWALRGAVCARQHISDPLGIEVNECIRLGGINQYIQIRGRDRRKPVLLFLHGGPGASELPFAHLVQDEWEKHFVCVQWEQRGAGRTFRRSNPEDIRPTLTIDTMVSDGMELVEHLCTRLGRDKLFLHGHSWGSALGALLAKRIPHRFHAYVGEGQVVSMLLNEQVSYDFTLAEAKRRGEVNAIVALNAIGRPPYPPGEYMRAATIQRGWLRAFGYGGTSRSGFGGRVFNGLYRPLLLCPQYSLADVDAWPKALAFTGAAFTTGKAEYLDFDLRLLGSRYEIPIFFFSGRKDYVTPSTVSAAYFEEIDAPEKGLFWFEEAAHSPQRECPEEYLKTFLENVAPFAADTRNAAIPDRLDLNKRTHVDESR